MLCTALGPLIVPLVETPASSRRNPASTAIGVHRQTNGQYNASLQREGCPDRFNVGNVRVTLIASARLAIDPHDPKRISIALIY